MAVMAHVRLCPEAVEEMPFIFTWPVTMPVLVVAFPPATISQTIAGPSGRRRRGRGGGRMSGRAAAATASSVTRLATVAAAAALLVASSVAGGFSTPSPPPARRTTSLDRPFIHRRAPRRLSWRTTGDGAWASPSSPSAAASVTTKLAAADGSVASEATDATSTTSSGSSSKYSSSSRSSPSLSQLPYSWKDQWYALTFESYVPKKSAEPVAASVFGRPLVLWRDGTSGPDGGGTMACADDVCPHRSAALSEGRVRDGRLECLYHGWQFRGTRDDGDDDGTEREGRAVYIPQLAESAKIPSRACLSTRPVEVVEGIVFVWMGDDRIPTKLPPRSRDDLDSAPEGTFVVNSFQIDLPYDHSYLVENLIDPAHIPVSHDRTSGGGMREDAMPYDMEVDEASISPDGFVGRYRNTRQLDSAAKKQRKKKEAKGSNDEEFPWTETTFEAPGIVRYRVDRGGKFVFGGALHCMPTGYGRCRLLFRTYFRGAPKILALLLKLKPQFLINLNSCKVLEQDVGLITTQEDHFARNPGRTLADDFLLLNSSDMFVGAYRRWLDRVGHGMPWYRGLTTDSDDVASTAAVVEGSLPPSMVAATHRSVGVAETRYHRHVVHCPTTRDALRRVRASKRALAAAAVMAASWTVVGASASAAGRSSLRSIVPAAAAVPIFAAGAAAMRALERRFHVSFKRREELWGKERA